MNLKAVASLALVFLCGTADAAPAFAPKAAAAITANNSANQDALVLSVPRGGAGPLDPALTAEVFLATCAVQGVCDSLAPNKSLGPYGVETMDDSSTLITGMSGGFILMWIIAAWGALFSTDVSTVQAIGAAQIPIISLILRSILSGDAEAAGHSMRGRWTDLAIHAFASHACLSGTVYATAVVKALAVYLGLANAQCRLAPEAALKRMGIDDSPSGVALFATKIMAHQGMLAALLMAALVSGVDAYKALGYSQMFGLLSFISSVSIESVDFDGHGFDANNSYPWILLIAATVITVAF